MDEAKLELAKCVTAQDVLAWAKKFGSKLGYKNVGMLLAGKERDAKPAVGEVKVEG